MDTWMKISVGVCMVVVVCIALLAGWFHFESVDSARLEGYNQGIVEASSSVNVSASVLKQHEGIGYARCVEETQLTNLVDGYCYSQIEFFQNARQVPNSSYMVIPRELFKRSCIERIESDGSAAR